MLIDSTGVAYKVDLDNKIDNLSKSGPDKKVEEEILEEIEDEDEEIKEHSEF